MVGLSCSCLFVEYVHDAVYAMSCSHYTQSEFIMSLLVIT